MSVFHVSGAPVLGFIIYIVASQTVEISALIPFVLTLANTFGLVLIFLMLGYGLVEVPRSMWRESVSPLLFCALCGPNIHTGYGEVHMHTLPRHTDTDTQTRKCKHRHRHVYVHVHLHVDQ